jgi:hypothetical protein
MVSQVVTPMIRRLINGAWIATYGREHARFAAALDRVEVTQEEILRHLVRRNAGTHFGRRHGFAEIRSIQDFQTRVPVAGHEAISAEIEGIARGEQNVLTTDSVRRFQPTSGSAAASKLIPWTASAAREFRRGIAPWLWALYRRHPAMLRGSAYWSISPPTAQRQAHGRVAVGFDHDAAYLGFFGRHLFEWVSAVPARVARIAAIESFKDQTLAALLADGGLALISIWSPTFLTMLLGHFLARRDAVLTLVAAQSRQRADELRHLTTVARLEPEWLARVWPDLRVISCWNHGPSELHAAQLQALFPQVEIQGKGLIATEAFVSFPFEAGCDPVLAVRSHFFEFQNPDSGTFHLAHQLEPGETYRVVVTTGAGLYRYALGDLVRVTGFFREAPCLRFLGREGNVSDHFGEKLNGCFVQQAVVRSLERQRIAAKFFLLAPVTTEAGMGYVLFLETNPAADATGLPSALERMLRENFHYDHCRHLGQLAASRVFVLDQAGPDGAACYQEEMSNRGMKLGDIKLAPLDSRTGWERRFRGRFLP